MLSLELKNLCDSIRHVVESQRLEPFRIPMEVVAYYGCVTALIGNIIETCEGSSVDVLNSVVWH